MTIKQVCSSAANHFSVGNKFTVLLQTYKWILCKDIIEM